MSIATNPPLSDTHQSEQGATWARVDDATWVRGDTPDAALHHAAEISRVLVTGMTLAREGTCDRPGCTHDRASHWDGTGACGFCGCGSIQLQDVAA